MEHRQEKGPTRLGARAPGAPLIGVDVGPYRIQEKLGEGGMGVVYKAVDRLLDRVVALKILFEVDEPQNVRRFEQEAKALAKLAHANAIRIFWTGEFDGYPCFAMEYIPEGVSVYDLLRHKGVLPVEDSIDIIVQAAKGLSAARRAGIVHRDIKPNNLLIDADGTVKISDFGLAKIAEGDGHLTQSGIVMGTPYYMSPEQGQGQAIDHRSDLYSLGATFYHMITGFTPYEAQNPVSLIIKHVKDPIPDLRRLNPAIPEAVRAIVERCLEKEPNDRYQEYEELIEDLEAVQAGLAPAHAPEPRTRVRPDIARPAWIYFVSGLALMGGLWAALGAFRGGDGGATAPDERADAARTSGDGERDGRTAASTGASSVEGIGATREARDVHRPPGHVGDSVNPLLPAPGEVDRARAEIASSEPARRARAAATFGKLALPETLPLLSDLALRDPDPRVRSRATWALGRIREGSAAAPLIQALGDADGDVARQAISSLAARPDATGAREALAGIASRHGDPSVRLAASAARARLDGVDAGPRFGDKPAAWWIDRFRDGQERLRAAKARAADADRTVRYLRQRYGFAPGDKTPPAGSTAEAKRAFRTVYLAAIRISGESEAEAKRLETEHERLLAAADGAKVPGELRR